MGYSPRDSKRVGHYSVIEQACAQLILGAVISAYCLNRSQSTSSVEIIEQNGCVSSLMRGKNKSVETVVTVTKTA